MADEPKTAYELAMERLNARGMGAPAALSEDQKRRIGEVRRRFRAQLAELEVLHRSAVETARAKGDPEKLALLEHDYQRERKELLEREEAEVEAIRREGRP